MTICIREGFREKNKLDFGPNLRELIPREYIPLLRNHKITQIVTITQKVTLAQIVTPWPHENPTIMSWNSI